MINNIIIMSFKKNFYKMVKRFYLFNKQTKKHKMIVNGIFDNSQYFIYELYSNKFHKNKKYTKCTQIIFLDRYSNIVSNDIVYSNEFDSIASLMESVCRYDFIDGFSIFYQWFNQSQYERKNTNKKSPEIDQKKRFEKFDTGS